MSLRSGGRPGFPLVSEDHGDSLNVQSFPMNDGDLETDPQLKTSASVRVRDAMGPLVSHLEKWQPELIRFDLALPAAQWPSVVMGLELALYRYRRVRSSEEPAFKIELAAKGKPVSMKTLEAALASAQAVNLARHLVNLPPNQLYPKSYADFVSGIFAGVKGCKVEVWDEKRLKKENMRLLMAVGRGSQHKPRLVHIRYRGGGTKPLVALVGKGITFDSGGLDIKPSSGMRLMKKDMGGSAAVAGAALWTVLTGAKCNVDFYLALAENSVSGRSFRPSDVVTSRRGLSVEIHNTDAEGRLVLADALDVAVSQKPPPKAVVDVATLTGAIKVALGSSVAGLFSNQVGLRQKLQSGGQQVGELMWAMPLVQKYQSQMRSNFADMVNSVDGFGGAITAALFLEKFVGEVPWAHLDIYAWKDGPEGALLEAGGSGQGVLSLVEFLSRGK
ncbi:MAG: M17 family metallopeptidase [Bdellovibrionales bacterium]